jgi:hypothetical protein
VFGATKCTDSFSDTPSCGTRPLADPGGLAKLSRGSSSGGSRARTPSPEISKRPQIFIGSHGMTDPPGGL